MSYKKVSPRVISASTKNIKDHFKDTAYILNGLIANNITIYYIDEYNISEQDASLYNWTMKGKEDYIFVQPRKPSLHIIAAVTNKALITLHSQQQTIKSDDFIQFISILIKEIKSKTDDIQQQSFVLFFDNASIHKTKKVQEELVKQKCLGVLNCPYAPELNFCEKFIKLHKQRIRKFLAKQKILSASMVINSAKDISQEQIQKEYQIFKAGFENILYNN